MIRLELKDYCHDCCGFEADVQLPVALYYTYTNGKCDHEYVHGDTIVRCKHRERCANVVKYVMEGYKEKENASRNT